MHFLRVALLERQNRTYFLLCILASSKDESSPKQESSFSMCLSPSTSTKFDAWYNYNLTGIKSIILHRSLLH